MNLLSDILVYIRRLIKSSSNTSISDNLLIDYINRFYLSDVDARMQLFDFKTTYRFQTVPGVDKYNMPLYNIQIEPGAQNIAPYPVYQGLVGNVRINGFQCSFMNDKFAFERGWPNLVQQLSPTILGDGTTGPYTIPMPIQNTQTGTVNIFPSGMRRGHIDLAGIIASDLNPIEDPPLVTDFLTNIPVTSVDSAIYITTIDANGNSVVVADSGQFLLDNVNYGLLMTPGAAPFGNSALPGGYSTTLNTINYNSGIAIVNFPVAIPAGQNINTQCFYFNPGMPRSLLFYNNTITLRTVPDQQYLVECDAYLTPAAFLSTAQAVPFAYMTEYIARGAARKIFADNMDREQFEFQEPFFLEQEALVWKRSLRQITATRTQTIYSSGPGWGMQNTLGSIGVNNI